MYSQPAGLSQMGEADANRVGSCRIVLPWLSCACCDRRTQRFLLKKGRISTVANVEKIIIDSGFSHEAVNSQHYVGQMRQYGTAYAGGIYESQDGAEEVKRISRVPGRLDTPQRMQLSVHRQLTRMLTNTRF